MGSITTDHFSNSVPIYFAEEYIKAQNSDQIVVFKSKQFQAVFSIVDGIAHSFRQSPFGSVFCHQPTDFNSFLDFHDELSQTLKEKNVEKIIIRHPPDYYPNFIDPDWLSRAGFENTVNDVNQYIEVAAHPEEILHKMESRKLNQAEKEGLLFSHDPVSELKDIHSFIAMCRQDAGLTVNISLEKLAQLFSIFPSGYSLYSVRQNREILAACVVARPLPDVYYYYLPATHPNHKSKSPMVLLLVSLMETLKSKGARILDLGISSINGSKQTGLHAFKKRMGAKDTPSRVFENVIT